MTTMEGELGVKEIDEADAIATVAVPVPLV